MTAPSAPSRRGRALFTRTSRVKCRVGRCRSTTRCARGLRPRVQGRVMLAVFARGPAAGLGPTAAGIDVIMPPFVV
jgi:hypothetical protein